MKKRSLLVFDKTIERSKSDYNDLENYLTKNQLLDDHLIWFAGFEDRNTAEYNAVAMNLLYGNKRLHIISVKDNTIYYLKNSKEGYNVYILGEVRRDYFITIWRSIMYPLIQIDLNNEESVRLKVTKNKKMVNTFNKYIKKTK